jgi:hypothetical protein
MAALFVASLPQRAAAQQPVDPWPDRPICASLFLKADWQLTPKQRACNWLQNEVLSTSRLFTTAIATTVTMAVDTTSERGDPFSVRYGRKWLQGTASATGQYVGALLAHEDPRRAPPYLILRCDPPPHGFFARFGHALARNIVTTQYVEPPEGSTDMTGPAGTSEDACPMQQRIHKRFALSRVLGAAASGATGAALNRDRADRAERLWSGFATAYATSFGQEVITEFKPELAAAGGHLLRMLGVK